VKDPVKLLRRIAVTVVGTVILAVGVVLLVAPGPGLVVIALALAVFGIGAIGLGVVLAFTDLLPLSGAGTGAGAAVGGLTVLLTTAYGIREMRKATKAEENQDAD
jgi:Na+/proline symporter